jgi:PRC-barrel domain
MLKARQFMIRTVNEIGKVDHLMIDKISGQVRYAIMSFGGFLGLSLTYDKGRNGYTTNVTEQQLKDAPEFSDDSWKDRDWETRMHRHYNVPGRRDGLDCC